MIINVEDFEYEVDYEDIEKWLRKRLNKFTKKDIYKFMKENKMWYKGASRINKKDLIEGLIDLSFNDLEDYFNDKLEDFFRKEAEDAYDEWYRYERNDDEMSSRGLSWNMFI